MSTFFCYFCYLQALLSYSNEMNFEAIDCKWSSEWSQWSECDKVCGSGNRQRTRESTGPFYGGAECVGQSNEKLACNLKEELEQKLQSYSRENKRLIEQINCEVSKCSITVYRECINLPSCGSVNGINCAYLPDGIGDSQCATSACPAVQGKVVDFKTI